MTADLDTPEPWEDLRQAVADDDAEWADELLDAYPNLLHADLLHAGAEPVPGAHTPLHHAAESGSALVLARLLERGAAADGRDHLGATPLHYAALRGPELVGPLLDRDADPSTRDLAGATPLHWWTRSLDEDTAVFDRLAAAGADPHAVDAHGHDLLAAAAAVPNPDRVAWLLDEKAFPPSVLAALVAHRLPLARRLLAGAADLSNRPDAATLVPAALHAIDYEIRLRRAVRDDALAATVVRETSDLLNGILQRVGPPAGAAAWRALNLAVALPDPTPTRLLLDAGTDATPPTVALPLRPHSTVEPLLAVRLTK